jgi:amidase
VSRPDGAPAARRSEAEEREVAYAGVAGQAAQLADGRLTATDLVEILLRRIDRLQPRLNAFRVVLADEARAAAMAADKARRAGDTRPLLGVPIAVKDNVPVTGHAALMGTGSAEPVATEDDELVRRLRDAGMIVLGLTNLPELALWAATETEHHGVTRNPWATDRAPGGSSGGSAVAVAAGLVPAAHATDGLGSIRLPASACGLVGLKPTHGTVPLGPDIDHWEGLSLAGFLTRSVRDTAMLHDEVGSGRGGRTSRLAPPRRLRIAVSTKPSTMTRVSADAKAAVDGVAAALRELGHVVTPEDPPYRQVATSNAVRYLAGVAHDVDQLADRTALEGRTRVLARWGRLLPHRAVSWARGRGAAFGSRMEGIFGRYDVLETPTTPMPPAEAGSLVGRSIGPTLRTMLPRAAFTGVWNGCGLPALSVPWALDGAGLPLGVQLVGPRDADARLLALAGALERYADWTGRRPPVD